MIRQSPDSHEPAAPVIKKYAREYLRTHDQMTVNDLKKCVVDSTGYNYSTGAYAGAIKTLLEEPGYVKISRGVYAFAETASSKPDTDFNNDNPSLRDRINRVLAQSQADLRKLAFVDVLEINEQELSDIKRLKEIIGSIESLKFRTNL